MSNKRREHDTLGELEVPSAAYYSAQTAQAMRHFSILAIPGCHRSQPFHVLAIVKSAAVLANARLGDASAGRANAIVSACDDVAPGDMIASILSTVF